jgi:glycosyltransferase involved in cell wall biosynthesis
MSQTFIREQSLNLIEFEPIFVGSRIISKGHGLSEGKVFTENSGGLYGIFKEAIYKTNFKQHSCLSELSWLSPKLVHSHFGPDGVFGNRIATSLNIPSIITYHGYDVATKDNFARKSFFAHRLYIKEREKLKASTRKFIAVSDFIKNLLLEQGFPSNKVITHYIGIDTSKFSVDESIRREPIVLFVGRLVDKKGCEYLIRAMADVQLVFPDVELVIIGDGHLRNDLEKQASKNLKKYRFLGSQSSEVVKAWMNKAQVFSVPSIVAKSGDAEAFGIVFAEAQAMRLPVVSFRSGGIPEAISHGETGFLTPERDWQELARYIILLLGNFSLLNQFGNAGRTRVKSFFDIKKQTNILENIYKEVIIDFSRRMEEK